MFFLSFVGILTAEPTVSLGTHPVVAAAGSLQSSASVSPMSSSNNQLILITDVILTTNPQSNCSSEITFTLANGDTIGYFWLGAQKQASNNNYGPISYSSAPSVIQHNFTSGLPIPISDVLTITNAGNCSVAYTISGHYAQP